MTSYQILKRKCEYLQRQVDMFKNALTIVRQEPQVVEDFSADSVSLAMRALYSIVESEINKEMKEHLNHWVANNLDEDTIKRLLELKHDKK